MIILRKLAAQTVSTSVVVAGILAGDKNGFNKTYTTTYDYKVDRISVFLNGQALHTPGDFSMTGSNEIEFIYITPEDDDVLRATYELEGTDYTPAPMYTPLAGSTAVSIGAESKTINFGTVLSDTTYKVNVDLITTDSTPSVYSFVISDKTTSNFTVYFSGDIDTSNYTLEWAVLE